MGLRIVIPLFVFFHFCYYYYYCSLIFILDPLLKGLCSLLQNRCSMYHVPSILHILCHSLLLVLPTIPWFLFSITQIVLTPFGPLSSSSFFPSALFWAVSYLEPVLILVLMFSFSSVSPEIVLESLMFSEFYVQFRTAPFGYNCVHRWWTGQVCAG